MASRVVMPKLSDTMEEGKILRWLRKEGDRVETGQPFAEIETDKATVEMEAYSSGIVRRLVAHENQIVKIGQLIAVIADADEDVSALLDEQPGVTLPEPPARAVAEPPVAAAPPAVTAPALSAGRAIKASPLALRMAAEANLDLSRIAGTGPQGRIIKRDIEAALAASTPVSPAVRPSAVERPKAVVVAPPRGEAPETVEIELSTMRRTIARRLVQSKAPVPHFYLTVDVAMDRAWDAYQALKKSESSVTLNDIIVKAAATALRRHPELNASFAGDRVKQFGRVHIGIAVAIEDGLITPVLRDADSKSVEEIAAESKTLIERARTRKLQPEEYTGATFSVSNLGMFGIEEFAAIINPPEAAILAIGAVRQTPVVGEGQIRVGYRMKLTVSVDHRVTDGATAARFLQTLQRMLENPFLMA